MASPHDIINRWFVRFGKPSKRFGTHIWVRDLDSALANLFAGLKQGGCTMEDAEALVPTILSKCHPKKHPERQKLEFWKLASERRIWEFLNAAFEAEKQQSELETQAREIANRVSAAADLRPAKSQIQWWRMGEEIDRNALLSECEHPHIGFVPDPEIDAILEIEWGYE